MQHDKKAALYGTICIIRFIILLFHIIFASKFMHLQIYYILFILPISAFL